MGKLAVQLKGLSKSKIKFLSATANTTEGRGIAGASLVEPLPNFIAAECETVYEGKNNTFIILGRDRPSTRDSGYGGLGDTQSGMIDIVAGRIGSEVREVNENNEKIFVDPDLRRDAARIFISQKTDIDEYFKLADGLVGNAVAKSAIAIKADNVRLISREGMKLVTGTDPMNSQGGSVMSVGGIDLIAGNNDKDMQPFVKGDNLTDCLQEVITKISQLDGTLINFINYQLRFNFSVMNHYHYSPFFGIPTSMDIDIMPQEGLGQIIKMLTNTVPALVNHKMNLKTLGHNYLKLTGKKYINSRYNSTN